MRIELYISHKHFPFHQNPNVMDVLLFRNQTQLIRLYKETKHNLEVAPRTNSHQQCSAGSLVKSRQLITHQRTIRTCIAPISWTGTVSIVSERKAQNKDS